MDSLSYRSSSVQMSTYTVFDEFSETALRNGSRQLMETITRKLNFCLRELHMNDIRDEQLMEDYVARGNTDAFNQLHARYNGELIGFLTRYLFGDYAEDVAQTVWGLVHEYREQFNPAYSFRNWLYMIATKNAKKQADKNRHMIPIGELEGFNPIDPSSLEVETAEIHDEVRLRVARLPEDEREIIGARYFEGMRQKEIAEVFDSSRMRLHRIEKRALGTLRRQLHEVVG